MTAPMTEHNVLRLTCCSCIHWQQPRALWQNKRNKRNVYSVGQYNRSLNTCIWTLKSHLSLPHRAASKSAISWQHDLLTMHATCCGMCRDGTVFGCGSTEYGQLPYLKFTAGAAGTEPALPNAVDQDGEPSQHTRNEVTVPTKLNLQFLQQQRGNKSAVVSSMVAGSYCSALLTRAPDELPDQRPTRLADRCACVLDLLCPQHCLWTLAVSLS